MSVYDLTTEIKTVFSSHSVENLYQAAHARSKSKLRPSKASNHTTENYVRSPDKGASVLCVPPASVLCVTPMERTAIGYLFSYL